MLITRSRIVHLPLHVVVLLLLFRLLLRDPRRALLLLHLALLLLGRALSRLLVRPPLVLANRLEDLLLRSVLGSAAGEEVGLAPQKSEE